MHGIPRRHLFVQNQKWRQKRVQYLLTMTLLLLLFYYFHFYSNKIRIRFFRVTYQWTIYTTRTTSVTSCDFLDCYLWTGLTYFSFLFFFFFHCFLWTSKCQLGIEYWSLEKRSRHTIFFRDAAICPEIRSWRY